MSEMARCQTCSEALTHEVRAFAALPRVTSDSKTFPPGGRLFVCQECGTVQKTADAAWLEEIERIYAAYDMYHQSASNDQAVFDPLTGRPSGRCEVLARRLREAGLPQSGSLLDVGAGSGAMIEAASSAWPQWRLYGLDLDTRKEAALRSIPRFERLFTVGPEALTDIFDLISLVHSLEHLTEPGRFLRDLGKRLAPGGRLFIEVNNAAATPFDLVVADHLCHFTPASLVRMVGGAGLASERVHTDWINKEISLLARRALGEAAELHEDPAEAAARIDADVSWLGALLEDTKRLAARGNFGIFGTSVAATWLAGGLGDAVEFFVDEDPARRGRMHLSRPILQPTDVPAEALVYLAFIPEAAQAIMARFRGSALRLAAPPTRRG